MNGLNRRSMRLKGWDYSQAGAYFVTVCVQGRECRLGVIDHGEIVHSPIGRIARDGWNWLAETFPVAQVDVFCVMPNHVHAIISIVEMEGSRGEAGRGGAGRGGVGRGGVGRGGAGRGGAGRGGVTPPLRRNARPTLGQIVARYKYETTKRINELSGTPGMKFWQRNYYEHVIRDEGEYAGIWQYIENNPRNWAEDEDYRAG